MKRAIAIFAFLAAALVAQSAPLHAEKYWDNIINTCKGSDPDAAINACTQILAGNASKREHATAFFYRGFAHSTKRDFTSAILDFTRAIELEPKFAAAFSYRGYAHNEKGDLDRAIADTTRAIELDPKSVRAFYNRGHAYVRKGDYERAIADFTRAVELDPKNDFAFNNRGFIYLKRDDLDRAIADLTRAIELNPKFHNPYRHRGYAYLKQGKLDLARADIRKALELKPDYEDARTVLAELEQAEDTKKAEADKPRPVQQAKVEQPKPAEAKPVTPEAKPVTPAVPTGKRVALVIGNSAYRHASELANPKNDAADVSAALKALGFEVVEGLDLDQAAMRQTVRRFGEAVVGADVALFFYAGHGLQVAGNNYLAPIDARLLREGDLDFETVRLDLVLSQMEREAKTNLVFLDACRDNPLAKKLARTMGTRSANVGRGLARVESGVGTFIAFATQPGNVALDGTGRNSPFTTALLRHLPARGRDLGAMMIAVRNEVLNLTNGQQVPWEHSSLTAQFYFKPGS